MKKDMDCVTIKAPVAEMIQNLDALEVLHSLEYDCQEERRWEMVEAALGVVVVSQCAWILEIP